MPPTFFLPLEPSGENAVELLDASHSKYRALVMDINLGRGKMDGWEVARHAREIDPAFPVVYVSGDSAMDWGSKGVPNAATIRRGSSQHWGRTRRTRRCGGKVREEWR